MLNRRKLQIGSLFAVQCVHGTHHSMVCRTRHVVRAHKCMYTVHVHCCKCIHVHAQSPIDMKQTRQSVTKVVILLRANYEVQVVYGNRSPSSTQHT